MTDINTRYVPQSFINPQGGFTVSNETAAAVAKVVENQVSLMPDADKQTAFLDIVAGLTPEGVDTPEELNATLGSLNAAGALLRGEGGGSIDAFVGDIASLLGRLMIMQAFDQREQAMQDRMAAHKAAQADLLGQADKMVEAAAKMMTGALTNLILGSVAAGASVAGSLTSAIGGLKSLKEMNTQMKSLQTANKSLTEATEGVKALSDMKGVFTSKSSRVELNDMMEGAQATQTAAQIKVDTLGKSFNMAHTTAGNFTSIGQMVNAAGDIAKSGGTGTDGMMQAEAKKTEAEGSRMAAEAQNQQQIADAKKQVMDDMKQMVQQIIDFIKNLQENEVDAMRAITKG